VEGGWRLDVLLANTSPDGVWSYPSSALEVLEGGTLVDATWGGAASDTQADTQLYGVAPCSAEPHSYLLSWADASEVVLVASARNNLGEDVKDSVKFALVRE